MMAVGATHWLSLNSNIFLVGDLGLGDLGIGLGDLGLGNLGIGLGNLGLGRLGHFFLLYSPRTVDELNFTLYSIFITNLRKGSLLSYLRMRPVVLKGLRKTPFHLINTKQVRYTVCSSLSTIQTITLFSNFILVEHHTLLHYFHRCTFSFSLNNFKSSIVFHSTLPCTKIVWFNRRR